MIPSAESGSVIKQWNILKFSSRYEIIHDYSYDFIWYGGLSDLRCISRIDTLLHRWWVVNATKNYKFLLFSEINSEAPCSKLILKQVTQINKL